MALCQGLRHLEDVETLDVHTTIICYSRISIASHGQCWGVFGHSREMQCDRTGLIVPAGIDIQIPILARQYIGEEMPSPGPECGLLHSTASIEAEITKKNRQ